MICLILSDLIIKIEKDLPFILLTNNKYKLKIAYNK